MLFHTLFYGYICLPQIAISSGITKIVNPELQNGSKAKLNELRLTKLDH